MGRASGQQHAQSAAPRGTTAPQSPDFEGIFAAFGESAGSEPDWRTPNAFYEEEARQFIHPQTPDSLDIDPALAVRLLKMDFDGKFRAHSLWYRAPRASVIPPDKTCPGMMEAGQALASAIDNDETIAVYCDYDVDGTAAGDALRRGLAPYCNRLAFIGDLIPSVVDPTPPENAAGNSSGPAPAAEAAHVETALEGGAQLLYGYADAQQGFGLTNDFVEAAHAAGARTLVTLDCGTGQVSQVKLAQSLGLQVIVVDHHNIAVNPADYHLNPKLGWDGEGAVRSVLPTSDNTGAQLAWKLAAATQIAVEGRTRDEHWEQAFQVAGMGCLADMGSAMLHENRAFFWAAAEHPPAGVRALAQRLGEDPFCPGAMITTQAAMNLPKRTGLVSAADIGALLAAETEEDAAPYVDRLVGQYEAAKPVRREMLAQAQLQTGVAIRHEDGRVQRPVQDPASWYKDYVPTPTTSGTAREPMDYIAVAVLDESYSDYAGYTGPVAQNISRLTGKPAVIFAPRGVDEHGQTLYKFSSRNDARVNMELGGLINDPAMRAACTLKKRNEAGEVVMEPVVGGHAEVVSGGCTQENLPQVAAAMQLYSHRRHKSTSSFWPTPWDGPEAFLSERKVAPQRLDKLEEQCRRLGPFSTQKQALYPCSVPARADRKANNRELQISVEGHLRDLKPDPENDRWLTGTLDLGAGTTREIRYPADAAAPADNCEFVLRVGKPGPYYLRVHHPSS